MDKTQRKLSEAGRKGAIKRWDAEEVNKQAVREKMYEFHGKIAVDFFTEKKSLKELIDMHLRLKKNRGLN